MAHPIPGPAIQVWMECYCPKYPVVFHFHLYVMAYSAHKHQLFPNSCGGATSAPPPTPSAQHNNLLSTSDAADALSMILHRLPPTLSHPERRCHSAAAGPPTISLSEKTSTILQNILSYASQHGFFQLTDHPITSQLANSAESESLALFDLPREQKECYFPENWPLGYGGGNEEEEEGHGESFRLDASCSSTESTMLSLASLREFTRYLEKLGLKIIDLMSEAVGFENPIGNDRTRFATLMWISKGVHGDKPVMYGGSYPFIIGLQYQIRCLKLSVLAESGWVSVSPQVDANMVTVGDISQVWSNGKLKKVRGRPVATLMEHQNESNYISMSLLITLPTRNNTTMLPLPFLPKLKTNVVDDKHDSCECDDESAKEEQGGQERLLFKTTAFEDYAWRVFHECLLLKDPLDRYQLNLQLSE